MPVRNTKKFRAARRRKTIWRKLKIPSKRRTKPRGFFRGGNLENLPEAETEVKTISKFYPNSKIFIGGNATEDIWREEAANYRILHLGTHGLSDGDKPLYSHVLLSADADDDGLIEAREIAALNLRAEMVVLSACETARGREIDGEGNGRFGVEFRRCRSSDCGRQQLES